MHKIILSIDYNDGEQSRGEEVFAEVLSENTAKIVSIPLSNRIYNWGDIVEFEGKEIGRILENTHSVHYLSHRGNIDDFELIENYFKKNEIESECLFGAFFGIAVPNDVSDEELSSIIENCPITINVKIGT